MKIFILLLFGVGLDFTHGMLMQGEIPKCDKKDGENIDIPGITNFDPCIKCMCEGGKVVCDNKSKQCPSVKGCYTLKEKRPDQCCQECQGCAVNGTILNSGQEISDPSSPCVVTMCFDGVITRHEQKCETECENPSPPPPGQCCPVCNKCMWKGEMLKEGETRIDQHNSCKECTCTNGLLVCKRKTCPVLSCPTHHHITPKGKCCPQCSRKRTFLKVDKKCFFRNELYDRGVNFQLDTCTSCKCSTSLTPTCSTTCQAGERQSCQFEGVKYSHGQKWQMANDKCTTCTCKLGATDCAPTECPACPAGSTPISQPGECCPACKKQPVFQPPQSEGVCTVFGDPHYKTFDGKIFNFQGSCKYLLTKDCSAGQNNSSFSIRITNDARDTVAFSWLRTVTVRLGKTKVSLLQKMRVKVDGKKVSLPYIKLGVLSVMKDGYRVILRTNEGARLLWDGVSFLELTVPPKMRGNMCGLCGNFNGDKRDDLIGRHGALLASGQEFGNSWRVGGRRACSVLPRDVPAHPPPCRDDWDNSIRSDKHCAAIKSSLFAACHNKVPPQFYFKACRIDMCECPGTQCHCEVLTAYARECERAGIRVTKWREETGCRNVKPFKYSGEHMSGETSATSDANATFNEVLTHGGGASEVFDDFDEPLDFSSIRTALPAYRPPTESTIGRANMKKTNEKEIRRREKQLKQQKRKERKRQRRLKKRLDREKPKGGRGIGVRNSKKEYSNRKRDSIGSFNGFIVEKISGGGSKKRLKWGGKKRGDAKPPPFEMLLSSVDESDYVPHTSGEERTSIDDEKYQDDVIESGHVPDIDYSDLPSNRGRSPLPLFDSSETLSAPKNRRRLLVMPDYAYKGHRRRDWKRRRHTEE